MGILLDRLAEKKLLVSDGAWGTQLQGLGLGSSDCPEEWNLSHPELVKAVAKSYVDVGSDLILTNTFGGSSVKLAKSGYGDRVAEFNTAGARLSLGVAAGAVVAGSIGPTGEFIEPLGEITAAEMEAVFSAQAAALLSAGIKVFCIETMTALEEAECAVRAVRKLDPEVDIITTFTFDPAPDGFRTMMGISPRDIARALPALGVNVIGSNCGNGIAQMIEIVKLLRAEAGLPILVHANAGVPELIAGKTVFRETPQEMASRIKELVSAGASIIGGCCGTTPEHITAIKAEIDALLA
ncbi:MAG: homocysteine S-methyltransferase family protein [Planctomycetes bacterium]|nr:homocysteine S-methyltransferase family protein [Planctomycetota bacterium]